MSKVQANLLHTLVCCRTLVFIYALFYLIRVEVPISATTEPENSFANQQSIKELLPSRKFFVQICLGFCQSNYCFFRTNGAFPIWRERCGRPPSSLDWCWEISGDWNWRTWTFVVLLLCHFQNIRTDCFGYGTRLHRFVRCKSQSRPIKVGCDLEYKENLTQNCQVLPIFFKFCSDFSSFTQIFSSFTQIFQVLLRFFKFYSDFSNLKQIFQGLLRFFKFYPDFSSST